MRGAVVGGRSPAAVERPVPVAASKGLRRLE